ncbi:MAG: hypothetical protein IKO68_08325 [Oscillospiraceae bacterium]|nr:hypothetical protein [Oscillospiraceae bacterium]
MELNELVSYLLTPVAQIALIIGLAELCKRQGLATRWIPLVDLFLGLVSGIAVYGLRQNMGLFDGILVGIACGLSACGLFSGVKNLIGKDGGNE